MLLPPFIIEVSQIIARKADQPDLLFDHSYSHQLTGERGAEVDFAFTDTDAPATRPTKSYISYWATSKSCLY